ncbi:dihydrodipicolinate synthase/N-acetylneuraminate lyase domain protein [Mycobacterium intracellulare 1956]|uniref:Dihydrodipicolinate synthase/N-acetylneuraminate lyase domain protein n=1 Tax=Mycobacterium intracellulare 1956 TaxID=1299331 RepID=X8CPX6_MYCIT|nr:dihydrodipicolinate synthase/N-acetylneuraminate lyase domain protein [Mycobacterium intracellulare 1956]
MVLWEAADEAGIRLGIPHPGALGSALYLYEKPGALLFSEWRALLIQGDFERADAFAAETGLTAMREASRRYQSHPARPECSRTGEPGSNSAPRCSDCPSATTRPGRRKLRSPTT